jgi:Skp family chaperone for outer membrane proteins
VRKSHWAILAILVSFGYLISLAIAQTTPAVPAGQPAAGGPRLALIDITRIFKTHTRFKQMMEDMKRDVQAAESGVKAERDAIAKLATDGLGSLNKGTKDYADMEEQIANRQAKLQVDVNRRKSEFLQRESMIYHSVYQEILHATDYFCKEHGIDMVLRFNGEQVDVQRPDSVLNFINRPVVWYDPGLDITDLILQGVNRPAANAGTADQRGGQPPSPFNGERR